MAANLATSAGFSDETVVPPPVRGGPLGGDGGGDGVGVGDDEDEAEAQRRHWERRATGGEWLGSGIFDLPPGVEAEERSARRTEEARRRSIVRDATAHRRGRRRFWARGANGVQQAKWVFSSGEETLCCRP